MGSRLYQDKLIQQAHKSLSNGHNPVVCTGTGTGKTYCFSQIIKDRCQPAAAMVHRKEIIAQISMSFAAFGIKHRVIAPAKVQTRIRRKHLRKFGESYVDQSALTGVVSVQTVTSPTSAQDRGLKQWANQCTLLVLDEGHHYVNTGKWSKGVEFFKNAQKLFVTACTERADGKGLGSHAHGFADDLIEGPTIKDVIKQGYLSPYVYYSPKTDLRMEDVPLTANGDINTRVMRKRIVESELVGDVVEHWHKYAKGKQTIVFANDVKTAHEIKDRFRASGVIAEALSGDDDDGHRDNTVDAFEGREIQVLINVDLFDEGFDVPGVECVLLARLTESLNKFLQMVGRGLRPVYAGEHPLETVEQRLTAIAAGPKPHAILIDPVRNWERHGMPCWPRQWTLDPQNKESRSGGGTSLKRCLKCTQPFERFYVACPYCGHFEPPTAEQSRSIEQVDGDLTQLDPEVLHQLREHQFKANCSEQEYREDQLARNIPPVGRGADMKRFKAAKTRRDVLHRLIGHWCSLIGNKPQAEIYKRFYLRFGVDMLSAYALNEKETDALITKIQLRFMEDLKR